MAYEKVLSEMAAKIDVIETSLRVLLAENPTARTKVLALIDDGLILIRKELSELGPLEDATQEILPRIIAKESALKYGERFKELLSNP